MHSQSEIMANIILLNLAQRMIEMMTNSKLIIINELT